MGLAGRIRGLTQGAYGGHLLFDNADQNGKINTQFTIYANGQMKLHLFTTSGTLSVASDGVITHSSDIRLKNNIRYITDTEKALNEVLLYKPCLFNMKSKHENENHNEQDKLGFIADELMISGEISKYIVDGKKYEYEFKTETDSSGNETKIIYDESGNPILDYDKPRYKGVDDRAVCAVLTLAIQELSKRDNEKLNRINELENKYNTLLSRLEALEQR